MKRAIAAYAMLLTAVFFSTCADAKPRHQKSQPITDQRPAICHDERYSVVCSSSMGPWAQFPQKVRSAKKDGGTVLQSAFGGDLVSKARSYIGQTASQIGVRRNLWCAAFMNKITGGGTGSDLAKSYAHYGHSAPPGCVGCIAVLTRGRGGHVGVVSGYDGSGNPVIISGNHNHRVGEGVYPRRRVIAWRSV